MFLDNKITLEGVSNSNIDRARQNELDGHQINKSQSIPNSIKIDFPFCEITITEFVAFLHSCDLESRLKSLKLGSKSKTSSAYHHT